MVKATKILQISGDIRRDSGIMNVILNWHRRMDLSKIQFDYLIFFPPNGNDYTQQVQQLGGTVYQLPHPYKNPFKFLRECYRFFKTHRYTTIHSHVTHLSLFFYPLAKLFGTKNIIQHAHGTKWSDKKLNGWRNYLMLHSVWPLITHKLACSQAAGEFWYKKGFTVINNGVDVEKFAYNPAVRAAKRKELGLENNFVLGHVGRFNLQKNHTFLIDIFSELVKLEPSSRLILVGIGPLEEKVKTLAVSGHIQDKVIFLGARTDVAALYQAFDTFCMPSFYEGLPMVGVEAQAAGVPCIFADTITPEVLLLSSSCMLSLHDSAAQWAQRILSLKNTPRINGVPQVREKGFDITQIAEQMQHFYEELEK